MGLSRRVNRRAVLASAVASAAAAAAATAPIDQAADPAGVLAGGQLLGPWIRRGEVARPGGVIGYALAGNAEGRAGVPVVLLPKLGGWLADWSGVAAQLMQDHRLIAIDPPGHGSSRMLGEPPAVQTLAESAAMVRATLDEMGHDRYALVGNSLGGCIAATLAALWPESITQLVLVSTAVYPRDPLAAILADEARANPRVYDDDGNPLPRNAAQAQARFNMNPSLLDDMNRSRALAGRWIRASERGVRREGLERLLSRVQAPTLLVYGDTGPYLRHRLVAQKALRNVTSVTIDGAGSFVHQEKPVETATVIREFLLK